MSEDEYIQVSNLAYLRLAYAALARVSIRDPITIEDISKVYQKLRKWMDAIPVEVKHE